MMVMDMQIKEGLDAFFSILQNVAPSLEILDVYVEYETARHVTTTIALPCLTDLTTHGYFPLRPYHPQTPILESCQTLRRLHIKPVARGIDSSTFLPHITSFAPALTHLCFSQLLKDLEFPLHLKVALGLTQLGSGQLELARLPKTIDKILVRFAVHNRELLDDYRELQVKDRRVVPLRALSYYTHVNNRDWLDVQEEYWAISDVDKLILESSNSPKSGTRTTIAVS